MTDAWIDKRLLDTVAVLKKDGIDVSPALVEEFRSLLSGPLASHVKPSEWSNIVRGLALANTRSEP